MDLFSVMKEEKEIISLCNELFEKDLFVSATFSSPLEKKEYQKIEIRWMQLKKKSVFQVSEYTQTQVFHQNFSSEDCLKYCKEHLFSFKQILIKTKENDYQILQNKKHLFKILKKCRTAPLLQIEHNRKKNYLWSEETPIPFLIALGITNKEGKVYPGKWDKFRQMQRFIEIVNDSIPPLTTLPLLKIVDFGCGKSYLTFALYHFLKFTKKLHVHITGLDLKETVINDCNTLAKQLGYEKDLHFICGNINDHPLEQSFDMMVCLHACNTATDAALERAIRWQTPVILAVPCCQQELYGQIKQEILKPLLKHGILKERLASLVTDAARAQLLEILGYQTEVIEFIDTEHTPKNLLIRAVKRKKGGPSEEALKAYHLFKNFLSIHPSLEERFKNEI